MSRKPNLTKRSRLTIRKWHQKKKSHALPQHTSLLAEVQREVKIEAGEKMSSRARQMAQLIRFYEVIRNRAVSNALKAGADSTANRKARSDAVPCLDMVRVLSPELSASTLRRYAACLQYGLDAKLSVKVFARELSERGLTALARLYDEIRDLPKRKYRRDETNLLAATKQYFKQCFPCGSAQIPTRTTSNDGEFLLLIATPATKSGSATLKFVSGDKSLVEAVLLMARPVNLLKA